MRSAGSCPHIDRERAGPALVRSAVAAVLALALTASGFGDGPAGGGTAPEARAVALLAREVPRWARENHCFSCHNNGDAARALYEASRLGLRVPADATAATTA
jgi:hypothetical protein